MADSVKKEKAAAKKKTGFFKGLKSEYRKISWPDRTSLLKQSVAVVCVSVVVGIIIAVLDFMMKYGVDFLTSL